MVNATSEATGLRPWPGVSTYSSSVWAVATALRAGTLTVICVVELTVELIGPQFSAVTIVPCVLRAGRTKFVPVTVKVNAAEGVVTLDTLMLVIAGTAACAVCAPDTPSAVASTPRIPITLWLFRKPNLVAVLP